MIRSLYIIIIFEALLIKEKKINTEITLMKKKAFESIINNKKTNIEEGFLGLQDIKWTIPKNKLIKDRYKVGDIIFVKKEKNLWTLKQYPKVK